MTKEAKVRSKKTVLPAYMARVNTKVLENYEGER